MIYNVLLQIPTSLIPMKKYLLKGIFKRKIKDELLMFICCLMCLLTSFFIKNLIDLLNLINLFGNPIICLFVPGILIIKL